MKIIDPSYKIINMPDRQEILTHIENAARLCYKSEDKIKNGSASKLLKALAKSGHHSVFEHISVSVLIICDRGVSHELVRHRLASFSQESTRYANYSKEKFGKEIIVIRPSFWKEDEAKFTRWRYLMRESEFVYMNLIDMGATPQEARTVLPNSLKTEIMVTTNLREWRHIFKLRTSNASHPQIREIMIPLEKEFIAIFPEFFGENE